MELFNLKNDLGESQDLSGSNPVKRGELYQKLMKWIQETHAPIPVKLNPYYREQVNDIFFFYSFAAQDIFSKLPMFIAGVVIIKFSKKQNI